MLRDRGEAHEERETQGRRDGGELVSDSFIHKSGPSDNSEQPAVIYSDDFGASQVSRGDDVARPLTGRKEDLQAATSGGSTSSARQAQDPSFRHLGQALGNAGEDGSGEEQRARMG